MASVPPACSGDRLLRCDRRKLSDFGITFKYLNILSPTIAVLFVFDSEICSNEEVLFAVRKAAISSVLTEPDNLRISTDVRTKCGYEVYTYDADALHLCTYFFLDDFVFERCQTFI